MSLSSPRSAAVVFAAIGLSLGAVNAARADMVLPVTNLTFNAFDNNSFNGTKEQFNNAAPTGWSTGGSSNQSLIGVGAQGFETSSDGIYAVYPGTGFSNTVPAGTNFYQADGNPQFESTILQTISGLTAGTTYTLQFQQAAGQQDSPSFTLATTEQWKVFLGVGGIGTNCGSNPCTVTGTTDNIENDSTLMNTPGMGNVDWNSVTMSFTPTASDLLDTTTVGGVTTGSAVLTFLAWGNAGSTVNEPPTVFLEGVNTTPIPAPEPATLSLLGVSILGIAGMVRHRRGKRNAAD
jgi:hypothetical protein